MNECNRGPPSKLRMVPQYSEESVEVGPAQTSALGDAPHFHEETIEVLRRVLE